MIYYREDNEKNVLGLLEKRETEMSDDDTSNDESKRRESLAAVNNQVWRIQGLL